MRTPTTTIPSYHDLVRAGIGHVTLADATLIAVIWRGNTDWAIAEKNSERHQWWTDSSGYVRAEARYSPSRGWVLVSTRGIDMSLPIS